jgi:cytochrome c biogenesis factor
MARADAAGWRLVPTDQPRGRLGAEQFVADHGGGHGAVGNAVSVVPGALLTDDKISVGPPFFNATFVPIMIPLLVALGVGPLLPWKRADLAPALRLLTVAFVFTVVVTITVGIAIWGKSAIAILGIALAAWLAGGVATEIYRKIRPNASVGFGQALGRLTKMPRAAWGMSTWRIWASPS